MIASPEIKKSGYTVLKEWASSCNFPADGLTVERFRYNVAAADGYALGLLIHAVFNPSHPLPATASPPHPPPNASSRGTIPLSVFPAFKRLLNPNGKSRLTPKGFLELGMAQTAGDGSGFFANNSLVKVCAGLDSFNISSESEKTTLLRYVIPFHSFECVLQCFYPYSTLKDSAASFPVEFASHRVLPALASALEFGGASAAIILPLLLQLGQNVSPQDYSSVILVHLVKLYTSPDRGTRMALLDHLAEYADKLDKKTVSDKIWPNLV